MIKKLILPCLFFAALSFASCGGSDSDHNNDSVNSDSGKTEEAPKPTFAESCKDGNKITMTIKGYKYGMKGDFEYMTDNFEVKDASFTMRSDSSAVLTLKNYASGELVGDRKDEQIDIVCELNTRNKKSLSGTTFTYMDFVNDASVMVTMTTSKGTVYFNWVDGMPDQGTMTLNFAEEGKACGSFNLAVEKPDSDQIGTVRLNGTFKVGE